MIVLYMAKWHFQLVMNVTLSDADVIPHLMFV